MDQQRNAIVKHIITMFPLSATGPVLCPQPKSSLINHMINDGLLDACNQVTNQMVNQMIDQSSFRHRLNSSTSRAKFY